MQLKVKIKVVVRPWQAKKRNKSEIIRLRIIFFPKISTNATNACDCYYAETIVLMNLPFEIPNKNHLIGFLITELIFFYSSLKIL